MKLSGCLRGVVESVRGVIVRAASNKAFNEQNSKASLIVPVLQALGWNTSEPDEVH